MHGQVQEARSGLTEVGFQRAVVDVVCVSALLHVWCTGS